jgi:hypothetical protein
LYLFWLNVPDIGMNTAALPFVSDRFVTALDGLYRAVAARSFREAMATAMILLVCGRIRRVERRIQALLARFRAGALPVAQGTRTMRTGVSRAEGRREAAVAPVRLPRSFGWLLPLVPCEAANFASQLRHTLAEPEMVALLAASAEARRILAPLCQMLAIEKAVLTPKPATEPSLAMAVAPEVCLVGWPALLPPAPPPIAPDYRYFRDGSLPHGPPLPDAV